MYVKLLSKFILWSGTEPYINSIIMTAISLHYDGRSVDSVIELNSQAPNKYKTDTTLNSKPNPVKLRYLRVTLYTLVGLLIFYMGGCATQGTPPKQPTEPTPNVREEKPDRSKILYIIKPGPPEWDLAGRLKEALDPPKKSDE